MALFSFRSAQHILLDGVEYVLDRLLPDDYWQIENPSTGEYTKRPLSELLELYRTERLSLIGETSTTSPIAERIGRTLQSIRHGYSDKQLEHAERFEKYLKELDKSEMEERKSNRDLQEFINRVAAQLNDPHPPSPKTIRRAHAKWISCGRDVRSLIPGYSERGYRNRYSPGIEWLIRASFNCTFLTPLQMNIPMVWKDLDTKISALNSKNDSLIAERFTRQELAATELEQLKLQTPLITPTLWCLYKRKTLISHYDILKAQNGKQYADQVYRTTFPGEKSPHPLGQEQMDETITDLFIVDDIRMQWLGRAYFTASCETYCHGLAGYYVGFEPHSTLSYLRAIRHSILPKTYIKSEYPSIKKTWDIYGVPDEIHLDNAMAAHGGDLEAAAEDLNITIIYDPPGIPWFKGMIERFFRGLNQRLLHNQQGTTFSRMADIDGDYDPEKNAVIPYSLLMLILHKWIVDIHLQSRNRGMSGDTPAHRWSSYVHELPPPLPPTAAELDVILGRRFERSIFHYGIQIDNLFYQSQELGQLRRRLGRPGKEYPVVDVIAPPDNLGHIFVTDPETKLHLRVPATNQEYTRDLSRHAHKVNLQYTKKYLNGCTDEHALAEAQSTIWGWILEAGRLNKTIARYIENHNRSNPAGALASFQTIQNMVDPLAGKDTTPGPVERPKRPNNKTPRKDWIDDLIEELPSFATDTLPDLSTNGSNTTRLGH